MVLLFGEEAEVAVVLVEFANEIISPVTSNRTKEGCSRAQTWTMMMWCFFILFLNLVFAVESLMAGFRRRNATEAAVGNAFVAPL
jgi:hypothetical protein